jgi:hypothetical protein
VAGVTPSQAARAASKWVTKTSPTSWRDPLVEDAVEEVAPLQRADRSLGYERALVEIERSFGSRLPPARSGDLEQFGRGPLHDRNELEKADLHLVAKEAVDLEGVLGVRGVDGAEDVDVDVVIDQVAIAGHDSIEGAATLLVDAVGVVQFSRSVDGEADEKVVLL